MVSPTLEVHAHHRGLAPVWAALAVFGVGACGSDSAPAGPAEGMRTFDTHREVDLTFENDGIRLGGTVLLPLSPGPHPGVVIHQGSGPWTRLRFDEIGPFVQAFGLAVMSYDKRGVGQSGGVCCPEDFPLLASDFAAAADALADLPEVDPGRIGYFGSSQGAWIVPIAAAQRGDDVLFVIEGVGGVVSGGEQLVYQNMTGLETCTPSGTPAEDIERAMDAARFEGFDPLPHLERMTAPAYWVFGENDASTPTARSVARLDSLATAWDKDWSWIVFPDANHDLVVGGGICQTDGPLPDFITPLGAWLAPLLTR